MREFLRGALAAVFLFGQTAFAFHHHEHRVAHVSFGSLSIARQADGVLSTSDDCFLCTAQAQPRAGAVALILPAATGVVVSAPAFALPSSPRDERSGRLSDRGPPLS